MRFLFFYLMKDAPDRIRPVVPEHVAYWNALGLRGYLGGPLVDRSGGLITFESDSAPEAERFVADDPFLKADLLERHWAMEWMVD